MIDTLEFHCPHCAGQNATAVDLSQGRFQEWIVDCEVCCRPVIVNVTLEGMAIGNYSVRKENE